MGKLRRRRFLGTVGATAGCALLVDPLGERRAHAASAVYSAHHTSLVSGTTPQEAWVQAAVDADVKAMTGKTDLGLAWESVFHGITASKRIAIKVNCLNTKVYPQLATVKALVNGMTQMLGGAYPAANISLFDNNLWTTSKVIKCYGAAALNALGIAHGEDTYVGGKVIQIGGVTNYVSKLWSDADYGVSLAKMSPHQYYAGGLSGVIKNMMGAVSISNSTKFEAHQASNGFHDVAPYTAFRDLFLNQGQANLQLYIVDMLFACRHENESGWSKVVNRITMGQDPCAVDAYNVDAINALGMSVVKPVTKAVPQALAAAGIGSASYTLVEPTVSLTAATPDREALDKVIRDRRASKATEAQVKQQIKAYREQ